MGVRITKSPIYSWENKYNRVEENFKAVEILDAKYDMPAFDNICHKQTHSSLREKVILTTVISKSKDLLQARPRKW